MKKILTIYTTSTGEYGDAMIRVCLETKVKRKDSNGKLMKDENGKQIFVDEAKHAVNSIITGVPLPIINPIYATVSEPSGGGLVHRLKDPLKGTTIYIVPGGVSHFYVSEYKAA